MKCANCQREIPDKPLPDQPSCGSCGGGCKKVHCPYCGYTNPVLPGFLQRLVRSGPDNKEK